MSPWVFVAIGYVLCAAVWAGYLLVGGRRVPGGKEARR